MELMRIRMKLSPGQRLQAMLDARMVLVGFRRARLRRQYPDLSDCDLNLILLEEIDRAKKLAARPHLIPGYPAKLEEFKIPSDLPSNNTKKVENKMVK